MDRRSFLASAGAAAVGGLAAPAALAQGFGPDVSKIAAALSRFRGLPGQTAYLLRVSPPGLRWQAGYRQDAALFVGSGVKAFINLKFMQDVEAGRLSGDTQYAIDDRVRSLVSPVFENLTGTTQARSVLEAMIAYSDNTATDVALKAVAPSRVRAFVSNAGFATVKIPTSTRLLFSYLAGAPFGVDKGWAGMEQIAAGQLFGPPRSPLNNRETMKCSASDFVAFYERALKGAYFRQPATLTEFKRIMATATILPLIAPPDTAGYAKGGSIDWEGFNCLSVAGQIVVGAVIPVTFSFTVNWDGSPSTIPAVGGRFISAIADALKQTAEAFG